MIRLGNLGRWVALPRGSKITFPGKDVRRVRLTVNSPGVAKLYTIDDDGELHFLAAPDRLEEVEFSYAGDLVIATDADDVSFLTAENEPEHIVIDDPEVFTEIAQRAARNPELERMMYMQQLNAEKRIAAMFNDIEGRIAGAFDAGQRAGAGRTSGENPADDGEKPAKPAPKPKSPPPAVGEGEPAAPSGGAGD
ncbi:hypothetical protein BA190_07560 [Labrys sp. WJW]|uniref:hypothetical protein n=1 Tax=Labrys sp. WJW TaxID=1737983 RepID=UPI00082CFFA7|nr:hypothetical protein [Labrys sp. WJW]OCC05613.1 hypothetical protein BA190_07560 [Labrys sp. WJW]